MWLACMRSPKPTLNPETLSLAYVLFAATSFYCAHDYVLFSLGSALLKYSLQCPIATEEYRVRTVFPSMPFELLIARCVHMAKSQAHSGSPVDVIELNRATGRSQVDLTSPMPSSPEPTLTAVSAAVLPPTHANCPLTHRMRSSRPRHGARD
jgi:hypothetical protein